MGEKTGISWAAHTHNLWWGCVEDGPECDLCYARAWDARFPIDGETHWGVDAPRRFFGEHHYNEPYRWNRRAKADGVMRTVFCMSMGDVMERHRNPQIQARMDLERRRLWQIIRETDHLVWMLLTKRSHAYASLPQDLTPHPRVWLGTTTGNQRWAEIRTKHLFKSKASLYWASAEPLLGPIDYTRLKYKIGGHPVTANSLSGVVTSDIDGGILLRDERYKLVITGGESEQRGGRREPVEMQDDWPLDIGKACGDFGAYWHHKQMGCKAAVRMGLKDAMAGADMDEWPTAFRVRQMPPGVVCQ